MEEGKIFQKVWNVTKTVPAGKVTTYGAIAKKLGISPRTVGWALHANRNSQVPCHRVVNKDGRLAPGYVFGGEGEQKKRLKHEGVRSKDNNHVNNELFQAIR